MREVAHLIRKEYLSKLSTLEYNGVKIPIRDTFMKSNPAKIPVGVGNSAGMVHAYIVIKNQIRGKNNVKNCTNFKTQLYLDVVTEFVGSSNSSAGQEVKDFITDEMYKLLYDSNGRFSITSFGVNNEYKITTTDMYEQTVPAVYNQTSSIFRNLINFSHNVSK